jgi:hypothetical protein
LFVEEVALFTLESTLSFMFEGEDALERRDGVSLPAARPLTDETVVADGTLDAYERRRDTFGCKKPGR